MVGDPSPTPHRSSIEATFENRVEWSGETFACTLVVVCFTNRSGSNLFCEALASTGSFPMGREFLNADEVAAASRSAGITSFDAYMRLLNKGATKAGRLVVKAGAEQLTFIRDWGYLNAFSDIHFVFCRRKDRIAQAVSFDLAERSGRWASWQGQGETPRFDANLIESKMLFIEESERFLAAILDESGRPYTTVWYENLEADPALEISLFGKLCGLDLVITSAAIRTDRQYSIVNRAWVRRVVALREGWSSLFGFELLQGTLPWEAAHLLVAIYSGLTAAARPAKFLVVGSADLRMLAAICELAKDRAIAPPEVFYPRGGGLSADAVAKLTMLYDADSMPRIVGRPPLHNSNAATLVILSIDLRTAFYKSDLRIAADAAGRHGFILVVVEGIAALAYDASFLENAFADLGLPLRVFATVGEAHFACHKDTVDMFSSLAGCHAARV